MIMGRLHPQVARFSINSCNSKFSQEELQSNHLALTFYKEKYV